MRGIATKDTIRMFVELFEENAAMMVSSPPCALNGDEWLPQRFVKEIKLTGSNRYIGTTTSILQTIPRIILITSVGVRRGEIFTCTRLTCIEWEERDLMR